MNTKNILVIGGCGFIGSNLCAALLKNSNNKIISLDNYSTGTANNHIDGVTYLEGETNDIFQLIKIVPDIVYHLGEYSRVEQSFEDVSTVLKSNQTGTSQVLEFVRLNKCKLVYAGSSTKFAHKEAIQNISPYSFTKAVNTDLVRLYGIWYNINYAITYFYNVYGKNEISDGKYSTLIEIFRKRMQLRQPLTVVKPGSQRRNFTHVDDIVSGLLLVGEKGYGDNFGIGAAEEYSIIELAEMFGGKIEWISERKGNRHSSELRTDKVKQLGWKQQKKLTEYVQLLRGRNWERL